MGTVNYRALTATTNGAKSKTIIVGVSQTSWCPYAAINANSVTENRLKKLRKTNS